jgi:hypothetical protein
MKVACVSSVYGERFHFISEKWLDWNSRYLPEETKFYLMSVDGRVNPALAQKVNYCFPENGVQTKESLKWGSGDLPRLQKIIELCSQGFICIHMDLDVVLIKNISILLEKANGLVFSRAFTFPEKTAEKLGFVGCTGFYIATPESVNLLKYWVSLIEKSIREKVSNSDQASINDEILERLNWNSETIKIFEGNLKTLSVHGMVLNYVF